jgi:hypothetical protein
MLSLLSTVSGYFSRSLILGAFFPTLIFVALLILSDYMLSLFEVRSFLQINPLDTGWTILSITFITVVVTGLLYNLNNPLIRLYEGYPWKGTWLGKFLTKRKQQKFCWLKSYDKGVRTLLITMDDVGADLKRETLSHLNAWLREAPRSLRNNLRKSLRQGCVMENDWQSVYSAISEKWQQTSRTLSQDYPEKEGLILPTRLGNVIRNFEYYPEREYRIDAVTIYPRLVAKIDKEYAMVIDDAKTSFDFMLNCSFLSITTGFLLVFIGIFLSNRFSTTNGLLALLTEITFFLFLAAVFYTGAINQAYNWGQTVKSAFDLYRNQLLQQLGFTKTPTNRIEERKLWDEISIQMIDGDPTFGPPTLVYKEDLPPETSIVKFPEDVGLSIQRSVKKINQDIYRISVVITNNDEQKRFAEGVVLTDNIPTGWLYESDSASISEDGATESPIEISGINPYTFRLGIIKPGMKKIVNYKILTFQQKEEVCK